MIDCNENNQQKRLLLLGGGFEQLNAVRIAKELGAYVIVFDGQEQAACMFEADEFYQVDIKDHPLLTKKAKDLKVEAVFVHAAELAIEAALVAEHLNLPGISVQSAKLGTDKSLRSSCLQAAGVRVPKFVALSGQKGWADWMQASEKISFPMMVKPTQLAGAQGVEFIENQAELKHYFNQKDRFKRQDFLLEEFVEGVQLSTESVAVDGILQKTSIALRHYDTTQDLWPYQIEDGHSMPWEGEPDVYQKLDDVIEACRAALEIQSGVLKGDIVLGANGEIIVLEMAVRTSGGRFCDTVVPLSSGVNILYPLMQMALGQKPDLDFLNEKYCIGVSQRFVFLPEGTQLNHQKYIEHLMLQKDVAGYWFRDDINKLETVPKIQSHRDRLGYVICTGPNQKAADNRAKEIIESLKKAMMTGSEA
jgi:biotin carboxylase